MALRRQQAQEEAEARELGIRLLRTEAELDKDPETNESNLVFKEKKKRKTSKPGMHFLLFLTHLSNV